jgi:tRNA(Ile)-lysidine synthase
MLKLLGNLPQDNLALALSGGVDSMSIAHFLLRGRKDFTVFHFNHGTEHGYEAEKFVVRWCTDHNVPYMTMTNKQTYEPKYWNGKQDFFREQRYKFFNRFSDYNIILAHHLDDVLETWLFSTFHGQAKLIPYQRGHMIRPFLLSSKADILDYAQHNGVEWIEDESNAEIDYMRNYIRHEIIPKVEHVNPGIRKVIRRKLLSTVEKSNV